MPSVRGPQSDFMAVSTVLVAPTSTSAGPAVCRPVVVVGGQPTRVLVEQMTAIVSQRLGPQLGRLTADKALQLDEAALLVPGPGLGQFRTGSWPIRRAVLARRAE